jgi:hypothetical protein
MDFIGENAKRPIKNDIISFVETVNSLLMTTTTKVT